MSDLNAIRDYLQTQIASIPEIGVIHGYIRHATKESDLRSLFKFRDTIRGWMITREAAPAEPAAKDGGGTIYQVAHVFVLHGYYSLEDSQASELLCQDHSELIVEQFETDPKLGGNAQNSSPVSIRRINHVMFGGVLCHHAELSLSVTEIRARV